MFISCRIFNNLHDLSLRRSKIATTAPSEVPTSPFTDRLGTERNAPSAALSQVSRTNQKCLIAIVDITKLLYVLFSLQEKEGPWTTTGVMTI